MSEQEPLLPRVRSLLEADISTSWFTAKLHEVPHQERTQYIRILRNDIQDSIKERALLQSRTATSISWTEAPAEKLRAQVPQHQEELEHAEKFLNEEKRRYMLERLVHDAKHEGLEALLRKVEYTIWGQAA